MTLGQQPMLMSITFWGWLEHMQFFVFGFPGTHLEETIITLYLPRGAFVVPTQQVVMAYRVSLYTDLSMERGGGVIFRVRLLTIRNTNGPVVWETSITGVEQEADSTRREVSCDVSKHEGIRTIYMYSVIPTH